MSDRGLAGQTVVIIGGTSGIGLAVAEAACADGAKVVVGSSGADRVEAAVARLGGDARGASVDVKDEGHLRRFFDEIGAFDHLVFTAGDWGARPGGPLADLDLALAAGAFGVRFWGALAAIKHGHGRMSENGSITLTDGMIAHRPWRGAAVSSAMAGAIEHLTQGLAVDLAPIRVNAVCPGLVMTERISSAPPEQQTYFRRFTDGQPLARAATPGEVAQAYLYLMRAGYTTGQVLRVDGGRSVV